MSTWYDVNVGDLVGGSSDSVWEVIEINKTSGAVTLENASSKRRASSTVKLAANVTIIMRKADIQAAAVAITQVYLGGVEIARRNEDGIFLVPAEFANPGVLLSHLYVFHQRNSMVEGDDNLTALIGEHHAMHQRGLGVKEEHVHDPRWTKLLSGVSA